MENRRHFNAGIVQFDVRLGNIESNLSSALKGIDQLKALNAKIALLPEMWSCGFDNKSLREHAEKTDNIIDKLTLIASRYNMLIAGSLPEALGKWQTSLRSKIPRSLLPGSSIFRQRYFQYHVSYRWEQRPHQYLQENSSLFSYTRG